MRPDPQDPVLQRFAASLARRPYCKKAKKDPILIRDRSTALSYPYVQLNRRLVRYLVFDIDRRDGAAAWLDADLPVPTIIVRSPRQSRPHLLYELSTPVSVGGDARPRPVRFMDAVWRRMEISLRSDLAYNGFLVKNPLHPSWDVITRDVSYELGKLAEFVSHIKLPPPIRVGSAIAGGRNCALFESMRRWAPIAVQTFDDINAWFDCALDKANGLNQEFQTPLPCSEVRSVARSVARYCWNRQDEGRGPRRRWRMGKLGMSPLSSNLEPTARSHAKRERHAIGGRSVSAARRATTEDRIRCEIEALRREFYRPTIVEVAERLNFSREHVSRKYGHLFKLGV
jgi:hypothetical protein